MASSLKEKKQQKTPKTQPGIKVGCLRPAVTSIVFSPKQTRVRLDSASRSPVPHRDEWKTGDKVASPPSSTPSSGYEPPIKQKAENGRGQAPPHRPLVPLVSVIQLQAFPVKLVSYELEFLSNAGLHAASRGSLARQALHAVLLLRASLSTRSVIPDELEACREVQSKTCVTVEEWSGLLCDSTGQHAVVWYQGRTGCLCASMFTLYLPECGAPTVGFWLKHIVLLIVHTGCALKRAATQIGFAVTTVL